MSFQYVDNQNITVKRMKEKVAGKFDFIAANIWIEPENRAEDKKNDKNEDDSVVSKRLREGVAINHTNKYMILYTLEDNIYK